MRRFHFKIIDSTNSWALRELDLGRLMEDLPVLVSADKQSAGKGSQDRKWFSPVGCLMLSWLVRPRDFGISLASTPLMGLAAAWAVRQTLAKVTAPQFGENFVIHWPNDLYFQTNNKQCSKMGGLLLEGHSSGVMVVGLGLNLRNDSQKLPDGRNTMISLKEIDPAWENAPVLQNLPSQEDRLPVPMERFLALFLTECSKQFLRLSRTPNLVVRDVERYCSQTDTEVTLMTPQGFVRGFCTGLTDDGALILDGKAYRTGRIHF